MGIHSLGVALVLPAEAGVIQPGPVAGKSLKVSFPAGVEAILFDQLLQDDRLVERRAFPRRQVVFAKAIEGERLSIYLFARVQRPPRRIETPEGTTIFLVREMIRHILIGQVRNIRPRSFCFFFFCPGRPR